MSRFLMIDIGAGTMDVLYYDDDSGQHYKAVAKSPVLSIAENIARLPGNLLITGTEMGGGSLSQVLQQRATETTVVMSAAAARTLHHNLETVRSRGIQVVEDAEAERLRQDGAYTSVAIGDLEVERLRDLVRALGVPFAFDAVGVCAQDHGMAPAGVSHLDYRHNIFRAALEQNPYPQASLYGAAEVPATFNRLASLANAAKLLPTEEVYVMDSGMAAILGASLEVRAKSKDKVMVLDVATSHTVAATLYQGEMAGFFEYHTHDITLERLETLLEALAEGALEHQQILAEGGHGAYIRQAIGFQATEIIIATGPKRRLLEPSRLPIVFGAPLGDNMMTGTVGLLEAIRRRKGLEPILYL